MHAENSGPQDSETPREAPREEPEAPEPPVSLATPAMPPSRFGKSWKKLTFTYFAVMLVVLFGMWVYGLFTHRQKVVERVQQSLGIVLEEYGVSAEQRQAIDQELAPLYQAYLDDELTENKLLGMRQAIEESPLGVGIQLLLLEAAYVEPIERIRHAATLVPLSDEDKKRLHILKRRTLRGMLEGKVSAAAFESTLTGFARVDGPRTPFDIEQIPSVEDFQKLMTDLEALLEKSGVSEEDSPGDLLAEVRRVTTAPEVDPETYQAELEARQEAEKSATPPSPPASGEGAGTPAPTSGTQPAPSTPAPAPPEES